MGYTLKVFAAMLTSARVGMVLAASDGIFRESFPANPQKPPKLLLEKVWGKEIDALSIAQV